MNILDLNFGHDAAATVIRDGEIASYILRERIVRVKHAVSLDEKTIREALEAAGMTVDSIDYVGITSSQGVELVIDNPSAVSVEFVAHPDHPDLGAMHQFLKERNLSIDSLFARRMGSWIYDSDPASWVGQLWRELFPEHGRYTKETLPVVAPYIDGHLNVPQWQQQSTLAQIQAGGYFRQILGDPSGPLCKGFYYPVTVTLFGRRIPAYFIDHHACHAASVSTSPPTRPPASSRTTARALPSEAQPACCTSAAGTGSSRWRRTS